MSSGPTDKVVQPPSPSDSNPSSSSVTTTTTNTAVGIADGVEFNVPETYDCIETLLTPKKWTEIPVMIQLGLIIFYIFLLTTNTPKWFYMVSYIFWRLAYNVGLGYILHVQSNGQRFSKAFTKWVNSSPECLKLFENNVSTKEGKAYKLKDYPTEFNSWIAYRVIVDLVLGTDLTTYLAFCIAHIEAPEAFGLFDLVLYIVGIGLCVFNVWAKSDAHRVLGDYAWYWGDFFFLFKKDLIFDGIFQMFPHPMYTVGYAFYYGLGLITRSKQVIVVSFCAHMLQLLFLVFVENPHIEKIYGSNFSDDHKQAVNSQMVEKGYSNAQRKENVLLFNIDFLRASDFVLFVATIYVIVLSFSIESTLFHFCHVVFWRLFHNGFLGLVLNAQSLSQFYTKLFEKRGETKQNAFKSWKRLYNFSLTINHAVFVTFAMRMLVNGYDYSFQWRSVLQVVAGVVLILLNIWQSFSAYEVLGDFGWFYGDFFVDPSEQITTRLLYTGIYRYLNNPEIVLGFAAYFGLALISHSWLVFGLAVFTQAVNWLFVTLVEKPHMNKIYGKDALREHGGISSELHRFKSAIASHPQMKKIASSPGLASKLEAIPKMEQRIQNKIAELKRDLDRVQADSSLFDPEKKFKFLDAIANSIEKFKDKKND